MHHPTDRIAHITALVTPVIKHWLERKIGGVQMNILPLVEYAPQCLVTTSVILAYLEIKQNLIPKKILKTENNKQF